MDWQQRTAQWLQRPQSLALVIAASTIAMLVAMQTDLFAPKQPQMCELISQCNLRHGDLQRIQVALGESGLDDFQINGQQLLVPRQRHAEYLKAVSERDALPIDLREEHSDPAANPLLSRSQQQALKWQRKKRQLKEMILRLPFVQQAWLEIDTAPSSSPFHSTRQSAVVSIQPSGKETLNAHHVDTLRRLMSGAVAGLQPGQIEVIDLGKGFAYDNPGPTGVDDVVNSVDVVQSQERDLENRIKVALKRFEGLGVKVQLSPCSTMVDPAVETVAVSTSQSESQAMPLIAGSNGFASIYDGSHSTAVRSVSARQVNHVRTVDKAAKRPCRVAVQVDVPEEALKNVAMSLMLCRPSENPDGQPIDRVAQKFDVIRPQIEREVASLFPADWLEVSEEAPVKVALLRAPVSPVSDRTAELSQLYRKYWPSVAAMLVGCVLLSLVVKKSLIRHHNGDRDPTILSMAQTGETTDDGARVAKETINRMFKDDPDGAAQAIEGWIKNAG